MSIVTLKSIAFPGSLKVHYRLFSRTSPVMFTGRIFNMTKEAMSLAAAFAQALAQAFQRFGPLAMLHLAFRLVHLCLQKRMLMLLCWLPTMSFSQVIPRCLQTITI